MNPQQKTIALFAVVGYVVSVLLSRMLWGTSPGALLLLFALVPCAIALGWVKILFLHPRLQTVPALLRGGGVGLLSYISFALVTAAWLSFRSSELEEDLWYFFLVVGTVMFGLALTAVGAVTGFIAEKLFGKIRPSPPS
ncbi:MAG TPA: hypothetical protein VNW71_06540 [Thermoanaerobaculia bacterium]|nr:hypothetical protein [Thermoanaerobaculia bacterium]